MHLIEALAAGIRGAENGFARVLRRGTSTAAAYYEAFEAGVAISPAAPLPLDESGSIVIYVNETVDVVVDNSDGVEVRAFTSGETSSAVEVISDSFTGVDYTTGLSGVSRPTTLQAVLDLWNNSAGSSNFNVLAGGTAKSLQNAFAAVTGLYFNVKDPTFGATGDSSTDDTSAIQAAMNQAGVAGGTVFFPPGTYRVSSAVSVPASVSILGCGAYASRIMSASSTADVLSFSFGTTMTTTVRGLRVDTNTLNTGKCLAFAQARNIGIYDCWLGGSFTTGAGLPVSITAAGTAAAFFNCVFETGATGGSHVSATTGRPVVVGCQFVFPNTWNGSAILATGGGIAVGNTFEVSNVNAGTGLMMSTGGGPVAIVFVGNIVTNPAGTTIGALSSNTPGSSIESGNSFGANIVPFTLPAPAVTNASTPGTLSSSRDAYRYFIFDNTSPLTIEANKYAAAEVRRTTATAQTLAISNPPRSGATFTLTFFNDQAAPSGTIGITGNVRGLSSFTVNANSVSSYFMVASANANAGGAGAVLYWRAYAALTNVAP